MCLCESDGRVYGGLKKGSIVVWDASTLEELQVLKTEGEVRGVGLWQCGDQRA